MKFVIMAGGSGTKLWPISRNATPKQFLPLIGKKTMFQLNVEALLERYSVYDIFVSTTEEHRHFVDEQMPQLLKENYIIEPQLNKDTGPASCYAMAKVAYKYPHEVVMFYVQSVCTRKPNDKYLDMIEAMEAAVKKYGKLITGTQIPKYVETGSDLMKLGTTVESAHNMEIHEIDEFIDVVKDRMTIDAVRDISNKFLVGTHCNHLTWVPDKFFAAIQEHRPDWYEVIQKLQAVFGTPHEQEKINTIFAEFEPGRIELVSRKLILQHKVQAIVLPYQWAHLTTWDDMYRYYKEEGIDTHSTEVIEVDSAHNLVLSKNKKLVSIVGVENMIVIETDDAILICPRDKANKVKEVNDILKTRGEAEYL